MLKSILETIICGGPVMIPIIIISLIVWALIIEKLFNLKKESVKSDKFTEQIIELVQSKRKEEAMNLCVIIPGIVPKAIKTLLNNSGKTKDSLLKSVCEVLHKEYPKLEEHLPTIGVLASVSPLLGLLGTVTGMVTTFSSISLYGTGDPQSLAKGISEALITTQSGLIVAIPALFFYNHLARKVENIMDNLEKNITKLINVLAKEGNCNG